MSSLCQLASDWRGAVPDGGIMAEPKIDGWRAQYFRGHDGQPRLWTRNGRRIEGAGHIIHRLQHLEKIAGEMLMFDGEFQVAGSLAETKRWCESAWKGGGTAGLFHAFDCVPVRSWRANNCDAPLYARKRQLADLISTSDADAGFQWEWRPGSHGGDGDDSPVRLLADSWLGDRGDVVAEARREWAAGGEGLMLKDPESLYRCNRDSAWQKVKQENMGKWS